LLSPRFHQWIRTNPWKKPNEEVSAHWRALPARQKDIGALLKKHRRSLALSPGYEQMARYIAERSLYPVLDIGCGDGVFLRYLHEEFGAPLDALWGVELDPKRMLAARRQVYIGAVNHAVRLEHAGKSPDLDDLETLSGISRRIQVFDLMGGTPWPAAMIEGGIKAATMIGVAPTMNDRELFGLAECVAKLGPEYVLTSDVYVNIQENYGGRLGLAPFFDRFGYSQVDSEWVPEQFSGRYLPYFVLQRPYWRSLYFCALKLTDRSPKP
jgi:hypothetical protein